jgi:hypothetical protein
MCLVKSYRYVCFTLRSVFDGSRKNLVGIVTRQARGRGSILDSSKKKSLPSTQVKSRALSSEVKRLTPYSAKDEKWSRTFTPSYAFMACPKKCLFLVVFGSFPLVLSLLQKVKFLHFLLPTRSKTSIFTGLKILKSFLHVGRACIFLSKY